MMPGNHTARAIAAVMLLLVLQALTAATPGVFDVRGHGAAGDGKGLDTAAIQRAVEACARGGGGQVRFSPGRYLSGTIHLKSRVTLFFEAGATLVGTTDLAQYQHPTPPDFMPEAKWGKWHRALILADGLEDIAIAGQGVIDGNKVFDATGEEHMRGPHTFVFVNCRNVGVRDVSFVDSANYAIFFQISDQVDIRNVKFTGGWDGVHFRGAPQRPCRDVNIVGCWFYTGDDCIAGRYWQNVLISDCIVNSSCNGIRLIGPAVHLIIHDCLFYGPGVHPHRTSNRYNMLAGINLQPGGWDATQGDLEDVLISDVTMRNVTTPFHFSLKPGNTAGNITVARVTATGVYRAACSVESWAQTPFRNVSFRDVSVEFEGGGTAPSAPAQVKSPGVDARPLPAWGLYARNVGTLSFENVRFSCVKEDGRPVMICDGVDRLVLDDFIFPRPAAAPDLMRLNDTDAVHIRQDDIPIIKPHCTVLKLASHQSDGRFVAGKPFSAAVTIESGDLQGLGQVTLTAAGRKITNWLWLRPGQEKRTIFDNLALPAGTHRIEVGNLSQELLIENE